jgi:hypothetical protein
MAVRFVESSPQEILHAQGEFARQSSSFLFSRFRGGPQAVRLSVPRTNRDDVCRGAAQIVSLRVGHRLNRLAALSVVR